MIDVDSSYDPTAKSVRDPSQLMTLDEHREIAFATTEQPGFGSKSKAAKQTQAVPAEEIEEPVEE